PATLVARVEDDLADAAAGGARARGHHLAEQRTLHALHFSPPTAGVAAHWRGAAVGAPALASVAEHRGVHGDLLGHAGRTFFEIKPHPQQRILTLPHPPGGS